MHDRQTESLQNIVRNVASSLMTGPALSAMNEYSDSHIGIVRIDDLNGEVRA